MARSVRGGEHGDRFLQGFDRRAAAASPVVPELECSYPAPCIVNVVVQRFVLRDGVMVTQVEACVLKAGDRDAAPVDVRRAAIPDAGETVDSAFQPAFGVGDVARGRAASPPWRGCDTSLGCGVRPSRLVGSTFGGVQRLAIDPR